MKLCSISRDYMVGYNPETEASLSKQEYAVIGATSSAIARTISQPLDVVKIRFQVKQMNRLVLRVWRSFQRSH